MLSCALTPEGQIHLLPGAAAEAGLQAPGFEARILQAFARGRGYGVLQLGAAELSSRLHPTLGYWRELGQCFVAGVCSALDPMDPGALRVPHPEEEVLQTLACAAPPMLGAELVSEALLGEVWVEMGEALAVLAGAHKGGVQGYLEAQDTRWNVVGRVCFHLAENRRDPAFPFAFIATYVRQVSPQAGLRYVPLGRALEEYAGARNRQKLLALLRPLQRAAEQSARIRELVDSGDIYHPLAWTPKEAYAFLCEVERYEQAGVVVRLPDWWSAKGPARPVVSVRLGGRAPAHLGMDAMLDFDVTLTLGGERLSAKEAKALLAASEGLLLVKGRWVEVDPAKLGLVLAHWQDLGAQAEAEGVSFAKAMRLLAGAELEGGSSDGLQDACPEWSEVVAGKWLEAKLEALRSPRIRAEIERDAGLEGVLRPYQKRGVGWLWALHSLGLGGCLADDMGLGKTIQVIALLSMLCRRSRARKEGPWGTDLLVVPASLIDNWRAELQRFAPRLRVLVAHASQIPRHKLAALSTREVAAHDAVITSYGTALRTKWLKAYGWRCLILDEAQAIKNPGARQSRALKAFDAQWRLALTGTPVENKVGDLWSLFDFLNPGLLGSAKAFGGFCKQMASREHGGYAPLRKLVGPYILRRLKTDPNVISDLPDKIELTAHCLLEKRQAALYQQSVDELEQTLGELSGIQRRGVVLAFLMRFKQICNHPSQWLGDGEYAARDSGKFSRLRELCEPIAARQDKLLVFTQFREMTEPLKGFLEELFGRPGLVMHGGTPVRKRAGIVRTFQESGEVPFMVLSLKVGGTGLNLTAASHVIHFDRWWNPAVESQATDRVFRIGQKQNVLVHKFVCKGTIEERIDALLASKQQLSDELLSGGPQTLLTEMDDAALLSFVRLDLQGALAS